MTNPACRRLSARRYPSDTRSYHQYLWQTVEQRGVVLGNARARMAGTWTKQLFLAGLRVVPGLRVPPLPNLRATALQGGGFRLSDPWNPSGDILRWQGVASRYQLSKRLIPRNFSTRYSPRANIVGIPWAANIVVGIAQTRPTVARCLMPIRLATAAAAANRRISR